MTIPWADTAFGIATAAQSPLDFADQLPAALYVLREPARGAFQLDYASGLLGTWLGCSTRTLQQEPALLARAIHPADWPLFESTRRTAAQLQQPWRCRFRLISPTGSGPTLRLLEAHALPRRTPEGDTLWCGLLTDMTEQASLERSLQVAEVDRGATLSAIREQLIEFDAAGTARSVTSSTDSVLGVPAAQWTGRRPDEALPAGLASIVRELMDTAALTGQPQQAECSYADPTPESGGTPPEPGANPGLYGSREQHRSLRVAPKVLLPGAPVLGFVLSVSDTTQRHWNERRIAQLMQCDELTGLLNRRGLYDKLAAIDQRARRSGDWYALLFLDLDHFKSVNSTWGHAVGDAALQEVGARLRQGTRRTDLIARVGGDEFVVVVPQLGRGDSALLDARQLAAKLQRLLTEPMAVPGGTHWLSCSIGIALGGPQEGDAHDVLRWSDLAMHSVKESGRNGYRFFDHAVQARVVQRIRLEQELKEALDTEQLLLHYQPIVNGLQQTLGYEALVRWKHPRRGLIPPSEFIPLAEQCGLIQSIGGWVLWQGCQQLARWARLPEHEPLVMSINVSARQISEPHFVDTVIQVLQATGANPQRLKLELTESLMQQDLELTTSKLQQLQDLGIRLSLDDFGTGFSSLSYVRRLPLDELKIDRSFVIHAIENPSDAAVARMIIHLAESLHLTVVAEGIETEAQWRFISALGCDRFQGFLFGLPEPLTAH
jgi:diguanylate cyclase (GGDEF)-like protein